MNKKFSLGVCISLIAIACAVTFVLTMSLSLNLYNEKVAGVGEREAIYSKLQEIDSYARNNFIGSIDEDKLVTGIMNGYMRGLGDAKGSYITAFEHDELKARTRGRLTTAGIGAVPDESGYIMITEVYEGSSAQLQGIEAGDIIIEIDGVGVLEAGAESAIRLLTGEEGARLVLRTRRDGEERRYTLIRQEIELITVRSTVHDSIGYIRITGFSVNTGDQFNEALNAILAEDAVGLIIDVRGAGGTIVSSIRQIIDRFLPRCVAAVGEYKNGNNNNIIEINDDNYINLPVTILTDANTTEGAELLTAVLGDFISAQTVGMNTKGDATFTTIHELRDGSAVILSLMKVRSARGTSFDGEGIKPDFPVDTGYIEINLDNFSNTFDPQLRKALEVTEARMIRTQLPVGDDNSDDNLENNINNDNNNQEEQ